RVAPAINERRVPGSGHPRCTPASRTPLSMTVKALTFDTYGTVVDWRGSVLSELEAFGASRRLGLDWSAFLADWRSCYRPGMEKVNSGEWPWTTVDAIYRRCLDELLQAHQIRGLDTAEVEHLSRVWWRL